MNEFVLGFDLGGTSTKYGVADTAGQLVYEGEFETPKKIDLIINEISSIYKNLSKEYTLVGVGLSVPGIIKNNIVCSTCAISCLYGENLVTLLSNEIQTKNIVLENDANCVLLAEKWIGNGKNCSNIICITIGTGVGGAIMLNDSLYSSKNNLAGEFGYMFSKGYTKGLDSYLDSLSYTGSLGLGILEKYFEQTGKKINGIEFMKQVENNSQVALFIYEDFIDHIATAIFNINICFDPDVLLIGGGISKNNKFIADLNKQLNCILTNHIGMKKQTMCQILPCKYFNNSGILGAVYKFITK